jgi:hypothetical protein
MLLSAKFTLLLADGAAADAPAVHSAAKHMRMKASLFSKLRSDSTL